MSEAIFLHDNPMRMTGFFECPDCGQVTEVTRQVWESVPVLGAKPTLWCCEAQTHIPPSPATLQAFERDKTLMDCLVAAHDAQKRANAS